ncbi:secreted protein [Rhodotorula toruloides]|uniref:BY PROTMAP: gi/472582059/gb/EMS19761.1/ secreted protein [Rhodosporidium toruloides NP11] gi/647394349/emb/CDR35578.1/ RHTO0S01e02432g1_1 [Rhodosporidium toruloides] n=1 Tax=Rhodotorula toruloides TaxID=5286 RepID=A0A0K3CQR3_RHOTO|nr:secreted protein [Rhodotorula toruloides]
MKTVASALSVAALVAVARAGGSIDNSAQAAQVASQASTLNGAGNYVLTNVKTGKQLAFSRQGDTTDFYPGDGGDPVAIQFSGSMARISGGNNKCASAQWSADYEGGVDYAAVSYACAVGDGQKTGTDTLEKTKQWWYLVPAGSSGDSSSSSSSSSSPPAPTDNSNSDVVFAASSSSGTTRRIAAAKVASPSPAPSSSSSSVSAEQAEYNKLGYWTSSSSTIDAKVADVSGVDKNDRKTWLCRHPGWWLADHPDYVTKAGHVECASDLAAYRASQSSSRMVKRHRDLAASILSKRGGQAYNIIAVDHLKDMATRAVAADQVDTFGGYTSTRLELWDQNDDGQRWVITQA